MQAAVSGVQTTVTGLAHGGANAPTGAVGDTAPTVPVLNTATQAVQNVVTTVTTTTGTLVQGLSSTVNGLGSGSHGGTG